MLRCNAASSARPSGNPCGATEPSQAVRVTVHFWLQFEIPANGGQQQVIVETLASFAGRNCWTRQTMQLASPGRLVSGV
jgi:hypothetical protein